jgi:transcriptional repressor NF-X1
VGPVRSCYCGSEEYRLRCGEVDPGRSCGEVCDGWLNCKKHRCEEVCHPRPCAPCAKMVPQQCYCGKVAEDRLCGTEQEDRFTGETRHFSCKQECRKLLGCGKHSCKRTCHPGDCGECELLPKNVRTCACGKTDVLYFKLRTSCEDPIPTCTKKCEKLLSCGLHRCPQSCHLGDCAPCTEKVNERCRCGRTSKKFPCIEVHPPPKAEDDDSSTSKPAAFSFTCNQPCGQLLSCRKHHCTGRCCPGERDPQGETHVCQLVCNKKLPCGKHNCVVRCTLSPTLFVISISIIDQHLEFSVCVIRDVALRVVTRRSTRSLAPAAERSCSRRSPAELLRRGARTLARDRSLADTPQPHTTAIPIARTARLALYV